MLNSFVATLERAGLLKCVLLAAASSIVWYILTAPFLYARDVWPDSVHELPGWLLSLSTGSVYSALVLFRYIGADGRSRAWGLAVAGALTYWLGVSIVALGPADKALVDLPVAGAITAGFLGYLVIRFGTLRFSPWSFVALCAAGALGGALIGVFGFLMIAETMARFDGDPPTWISIEPRVWDFAGHAAWQILTCVALYFTPRSGADA